ncbi:GGDEF domain-containing protein [Mycobacterium sp. MYCO198283]|uniref:diguanylate cyclase domain-containing protein n=1 Tax=Mycobacterium sp. MYCO198283 TaxID=2883505 RepID=UPI001E2EB719|nr:GGDEF domain-containing protein [Mycobacterium sp. MYCO198283]MCG5431546.1 GGDEF domain-containing protein [Mycobacterium sp. MYCO198283]
MIGTAAFAILASYVAFFHSLRLLAFVWLVAAVVTAHLAVELAEVDVSMTLGIVLLLVMVNAFAVFACRMVIRLIADDTPHNDLDPLTGLLNRDGFYDAVATLLGARNRGDDLRLVVVVLSLDGYSLLSSLHGIAGLDRARVAVARALRETARRDAVVAHPGDAEFWVADVFDTVDPSPLAERLRSAVATAEYRLTASVGVVCTPLAPLVKPAAYDVVEELLTIAVAAMFDVRKRGGNRTRTVIDPELAVLNEPGVDD